MLVRVENLGPGYVNLGMLFDGMYVETRQNSPSDAVMFTGKSVMRFVERVKAVKIPNRMRISTWRRDIVLENAEVIYSLFVRTGLGSSLEGVTEPKPHGRTPITFGMTVTTTTVTNT